MQAVGANPCEASLRSLYEKRRGSLAGFDEYLSGLRDVDRTKRKELVLAERAPAPATVLPFDLKTLDGRRVSLDSLKGKTVVVNFWGIWCGWCVREMPDYQKVVRQVRRRRERGDTDNQQRSEPRRRAAVGCTEEVHSFPVLIDDGYVDKVPLNTFPTTWFLDGQGRKVFERFGWSEQLFEEFIWRIEAIRAPRLP